MAADKIEPHRESVIVGVKVSSDAWAFLDQLLDGRGMNDFIVVNVYLVVARDGFAIVEIVHQQTRGLA